MKYLRCPGFHERGYRHNFKLPKSIVLHRILIYCDRPIFIKCFYFTYFSVCFSKKKNKVGGRINGRGTVEIFFPELFFPNLIFSIFFPKF